MPSLTSVTSPVARVRCPGGPRHLAGRCPWEAAIALVRFSGGGGSQGSIAAVTPEDAIDR